jgi:hypothetical protein
MQKVTFMYRVYAAYPHLNDDDFVRQGRDQWLMP